MRAETGHIDALIALTLEILKNKPNSIAQQNALTFLLEQRERIMVELEAPRVETTPPPSFRWQEAICIAVFWFAFGVMIGIGVTQ